MDFKVKTAKDWAEAKQHLLMSFEGNWIFRGQLNASWHLKSAVERSVPQEHVAYVENYMIREFKRRAFHYLSEERLPETEDTIEWLALMQHHGTPTRLVDWTRSPYVAAYFALESADENDEDPNCAVWVLDPFWTHTNAMQALKKSSDKYGALRKAEFWEKDYLKAVFEAQCPGIFPVRPYRMNERLAIQQGIFVVGGDPKKGFEENLEVYQDEKNVDRLWKVEIPKKDRIIALRDLTLMNISKATLFPGIDGFAQSLKIAAQLAYKGLEG